LQSEEELRVVRFSVPAIFVTLALAIAVVVAEVVRDAWLGNAGTLKPDTAPNFGDQLANNAILVASTAVSAFLVILTYISRASSQRRRRNKR
jgi:ABC-type Fe3+ transport system permease subunit